MKHSLERIALLRHRYIKPINSNKNAKSLCSVYVLMTLLKNPINEGFVTFLKFIQTVFNVKKNLPRWRIFDKNVLIFKCFLTIKIQRKLCHWPLLH